MAIKLYDSELKVMKVLWEEGDATAKHISDVLNERVGWNINTTYTVIKKCTLKGAIQRSEPNYKCHAIITKEDARSAEIDELVEKLYDGNMDKMFGSLAAKKNLSAKQINDLKKIVGDYDK